MNTVFRCAINLEPAGKGRPRMGKSGAYTPEATREWTKSAVAILSSARAVQGLPCIIVPTAVRLRLYFKQPASAKGKLASLPCTKKPDGDNVEKMALDCLVKAGIIGDDSSVASCSWEKIWSTGSGWVDVEVLA